MAKVMVTVKMLASESGLPGKRIRRKLRKAKMGVGFGKSYEWPENGVDIKRVRSLLGIKTKETIAAEELVKKAEARARETEEAKKTVAA